MFMCRNDTNTFKIINIKQVLNAEMNRKWVELQDVGSITHLNSFLLTTIY